MLLDAVKKYYNKDYDLNCAEAILYAANETYKLNLDKNALKTMAAFGGGMAIEETCGALTGALAVLGILFVKDKAHESDRIKELAKEFFKRFQSKLSTDNCKKLKELYRNDEERCSYIVFNAAEILNEMILEENCIN
ncbi:C-GCAxxG-C-C family (seleno)protein [Lutispora thermophila]|uniref:C_GCAxxG_C_C family probable redox protein n=1 Tax=Lutispora thermophila DSM 19022 TaxID=1122184 RepID=A0A1M6CDD9_9FIRM|nr:C-GCAxxG-C-C family (seleno)protein [Lutispora thermophila]SHI59032.1 C_GCAxxG_C_C family probable redox protein [Lutispora thermophila DSM 19022]